MQSLNFLLYWAGGGLGGKRRERLWMLYIYNLVAMFVVGKVRVGSRVRARACPLACASRSQNGCAWCKLGKPNQRWPSRAPLSYGHSVSVEPFFLLQCVLDAYIYHFQPSLWRHFRWVGRTSRTHLPTKRRSLLVFTPVSEDPPDPVCALMCLPETVTLSTQLI